ncbi:MAG: flagellar hook-length control protein FliK [Zoogloea sp.]|uniref:flagellar hook-length control protein FliK n=1 Tax=Zoogloea sp. TaxID=49181 RepID=UPI00263026A0|nr:flagellar hook-length control protein FliK [Zoogloea sp.]MDD2990045.1 flagellar hook-length control protein FliK [Zoogloea sp.]
MIPGDLAARLRMLTEASFFSGEQNVAPLARTRAIPADLPSFTPGERITATLQNINKDQTVQGRVNGRDVVLSLPQSVKAGDTLELIVSEVTPRAIFASLANPAPQPSDKPALSQAGKLISFLLTGQPSPGAARLNGGEALAPAPPQSAAATAQLAARLGTAVSESGLFYESHQTRWLAGQMSTAALQKEPQGQLAARHQASAGLVAANVAGADEAGSTSTTTMQASATSRAADSAPVAERLLPLVHQQLDTLATHQIVWQGQIWPGQQMEWEIEDPGAHDASDDDAPEPNWNTTLRLTLPGLGGIEARLHLTPAGVAVRLVAGDARSRDILTAGQPRLAEALDAVNIPLTGMVAELAVPDEQP